MKEVKVTGDKDLFELLYRVDNEETGVMHEASAMAIEDVGCVVRTKTIIHGEHVSESTCFVPGVGIVPNGKGNKLEEI